MKAFSLVVLFVTAAMAQYYNSEQYPTVPSNGPYYYQGAQYQPIVPYQPASADGQWQTLRDARHQYPSGEYSYEYETQNGIIANEQSYIAGPNQAQRKTGFFQYPSPDGRILRVDYTADENGFQATGDHLPTSQPIASPIDYNSNQANKQYLQEAYVEQGY